MEKRIGVIEGNWDDDASSEDNIVIRPLFDFLSDIHYQDHHSYLYHMAETKEAFKHALLRIAKSKKAKVACLAMHGNERYLFLDEGQKVGRKFLKNWLIEANNKKRGTSLTGIYIGACKFGSRELAEYLFSEEIRVEWIAGYKKSVDFVESSALDLFFFNLFLDLDDSKKWSKRSDRAKIKEIASRMKSQMLGLCKNLGFSIYVRECGSASGVCDLLRT